MESDTAKDLIERAADLLGGGYIKRLSRYVDVSQQYLSMIKDGKRSMTPQVKGEIERALRERLREIRVFLETDF